MFITMESTFVFQKEDRKGNDDYINEQIKKHPTFYLQKQLQVQCVKEKVSAGDIKGAQEIGRRT